MQDQQQVLLPWELPPSFRGSGVRFAYAILMGAKLVGCDQPVISKQRLVVMNPFAGTLLAFHALPFPLTLVWAAHEPVSQRHLASPPLHKSYVPGSPLACTTHSSLLFFGLC